MKNNVHIFEQMIPMRRLIELVELNNEDDANSIGSSSPTIFPPLASKKICYQFLQRNEASMLPKFTPKITKSMKKESIGNSFYMRSRSFSTNSTIASLQGVQTPEKPRHVQPATAIAMPKILKPSDLTSMLKNIIFEHSQLCVDCMKNTKIITFSTCRHRSICFDCAPKYVKTR